MKEMKPTLQKHAAEHSGRNVKLSVHDDVDSFTVTLDDNQLIMLVRDLTILKPWLLKRADDALPF